MITSSKKTKVKEAKKTGEGQYVEAVGRRKSASARARLFTKGSGITVNGKRCDLYFPLPELQRILIAPLRKLKLEERFSVSVKVSGGGIRGQAEAARHAIARALVKTNVEFRRRLKRSGFLTRDPRVKERRKYGLKKARRAPQWQKR